MTHYNNGRAFEWRVRDALTDDGYDVSVISRFFAKASQNRDGCWIWTASVNKNGYGRFWPRGGDGWLAHRWIYSALYGEPSGLVIDHLCRVPACVNPGHLEAVPQVENVRRGLAGETTRLRMLTKTHCARGHEWTDENTKVTPRQRKCRACIREDSARARERRRSAA